MHTLWITGCFSVGVALSGAAQANTYSADCHAEANAAAYSGSKAGYSQSYDAAYQACVGRQQAQVQVPQRRYRHKPTTYVKAPEVVCHPGAPRLYRGTVYCFD